MLKKLAARALSHRHVAWKFIAEILAFVGVALAVAAHLLKLARPAVDLYVSVLPYRFLSRSVGKVAVVRVDRIGDFILWLDGARAIRTRYPRPHYQLTLIGASEWRDYAELSHIFDQVIAVDRIRFLKESRYRAAKFREIARARFETAISPTFSRDWTDDSLIKATGSPVCIGQKGDLSNSSPLLRRMTDRWYTELAPSSNGLAHELVKNHTFARRFQSDIVLRHPRLEPGMVRRPAWIEAKNHYFALFSGSASVIRKWPAQSFAELARRIHARTGWAGIACGLASDSTIVQRIIGQAAGVPLMNACGNTTLPELAGVIANAKLTITNETSAAHLAAALGVPAVVILGGGHFGRFFPYPAECKNGDKLLVAHHAMPCFQCNWNCVHLRGPEDPGPCVSHITVDDVWALVESLLEAHGGARTGGPWQ